MKEKQIAKEVNDVRAPIEDQDRSEETMSQEYTITTSDNDDDDDEEEEEEEDEVKQEPNHDNDDNINSPPPPPPPKFAIKQRVLARDTDTPLLYDAIIRKQLYAPKSNKVQICRVQLLQLSNSGDHDAENLLDHQQLDDLLSSSSEQQDPQQQQSYTWHYFVHYQGWNVKWDRWVQEESLFEDKESTRVLANTLKDESKCLRGKAKKSDKVVMGVMQRMLKLEMDFREKEAKGEAFTVTVDNPSNEKKGRVDDEKNKRNDDPKKDGGSTLADTKKSTTINTATAKFVQNEVEMRKRDLCSKKPSNAINIPFTIKKVLTDEWEVISQCGMVHNLPASVSVMDALNAYFDGKIQMLRNDTNNSNNVLSMDDIEEKKDDQNMAPSSLERNGTEIPQAQDGEEIGQQSDNNILNAAEQDWKDMIQGIAMYFDQLLPKQLLYRHELPQHLVIESQHIDKRYCELYPCEHLLRLLCLKLPELVESANDLTDDEKNKITFKVGDLIRFLQKHQDIYLLQRYRKPNLEESDKAKRLQSRLGLVTKKNAIEDSKDDVGGDNDDGSEDEDTGNSGHDMDDGNKKRKKKGDNKGSRKKTHSM